MIPSADQCESTLDRASDSGKVVFVCPDNGNLGALHSSVEQVPSHLCFKGFGISCFVVPLLAHIGGNVARRTVFVNRDRGVLGMNTTAQSKDGICVPQSP